MQLLKNIKTLFLPRPKVTIGVEKRKFIRFRPPMDYPLSAELMAKGLTSYQRIVLDLSLFAVALQIGEEEKDLFQQNQRVPFALLIEGKRLPFEGEIIRTVPGRVVLSYVDLTKEKSEVLSACFMKILGSTLHQLSLGQQKNLEEPSFWIHGDYNSDLFIWRGVEEAEVKKFLFLFADNFLEFEMPKRILTGVIERKRYADSLNFAKKEENPRIFDDSPKVETINLAKVAINEADIDTNLKNNLINLLA